ncbi:dual specificity protein phosphatase 14 isoform X2 [Ascaphus truei]|uniref:dual specificity protein phosphatase 14 isoform X2 n=1 Tax=Ascaphus truei TaxID=8439 RepID=UPI003F59A641
MFKTFNFLRYRFSPNGTQSASQIQYTAWYLHSPCPETQNRIAGDLDLASRCHGDSKSYNICIETSISVGRTEGKKIIDLKQESHKY